jgi:hypothetical protein
LFLNMFVNMCALFWADDWMATRSPSDAFGFCVCVYIYFICVLFLADDRIILWLEQLEQNCLRFAASAEAAWKDEPASIGATGQ